MKDFKFDAVLSRTTTDMIKSKIMSPTHVSLVLDVYMTPETYAKLLSDYWEEDFTIEIQPKEVSHGSE